MTKSTTFAPTTLEPLKRFVPPRDENEIATRIVGAHTIMMAIIGISFNVFMFFHFLSLEKLSFFILCTSKTISNTMSLLVYLCYIGPVNLFYTSIGTMFLNIHLQQIFGAGLFLQGTMTQMLITVNRFLVIFFSPTDVSKNSKRMTMLALAVVWILFIWWSTLPGFPDDCFVPFGLPHVGYYQTDCNQMIVKWSTLVIFLLAVFNNLMNGILAVKLAMNLRKQKGLSSEAAKNRRRQTFRFFIQSVIQDWMTAIVAGTNIFLVTFVCRKKTCIILTTFGVDSMSYATDGIVMFLFNYKRKSPKVSPNFKKVSSNSQKISTSSSVTN